MDRGFLMAVLIGFFAVFGAGGLSAQEFSLLLETRDARLEPAYWVDGTQAGFYLFVRKKPRIESVMLVMPTVGLALRAKDWNRVNGEEERLVDGKKTGGSAYGYSIVSSTPRQNLAGVELYQFFVPFELYYGNSANTLKMLRLVEGLEVEIWAYPVPYADNRTLDVGKTAFRFVTPRYSRPTSSTMPEADADMHPPGSLRPGRLVPHEPEYHSPGAEPQSNGSGVRQLPLSLPGARGVMAHPDDRHPNHYGRPSQPDDRRLDGYRIVLDRKTPPVQRELIPSSLLVSDPAAPRRRLAPTLILELMSSDEFLKMAGRPR